MMTLNVELETNNGSERQTEGGVMALNAKPETNNGFKIQTEDVALNAKTVRDSGSECRTEKGWWL